MISIYITNDIEHLFLCLYAISIFFKVKFLFKSFLSLFFSNLGKWKLKPQGDNVHLLEWLKFKKTDLTKC